MNKWAQETARLAKEGDYLDRLHAIYPSEAKTRIVPKAVKQEIERAYNNRDKITLLDVLLNQERFPFDDSYVQFLRSDRAAIARNPKTVERLCLTLSRMGLPKVLKGVSAPIVPNRRRGAQFRQWAKAHFQFMESKKFEASRDGMVFLDASEKALRDYANAKFGAGLKKRPDFVAKSGSKYVVGEAKFLSSAGGEQAGGFEDAVSVAAHPAGGAVKVSILDGIVWLESSSGFYQFIENSSINVFSALLLKDFLRSLS